MSKNSIPNYLADTWWYGLSKRLPAEEFRRLASLRAEQGFSGVQLVVGIPPEVGPQNDNARSDVGFPWTLNGSFNSAYLALARERVQILNHFGLTAVVYGAWGHQIAWLGKQRMAEWWHHIIDALDPFDVIYCLCGESNLWPGQESMLLPDKSTDDLVGSRNGKGRVSPLSHLIKLARGLDRQLGIQETLFASKLEQRRDDWGYVLESISAQTSKPILVHPISSETGYEAVPNSDRLSANTAQTGHSPATRSKIWRVPIELFQKDRAPRGYVNLEPWYEGIRDQFWGEDQIFAYWASMLAGASAHCYGAHGIWNVGDGKFLSHWGKQTFSQAVRLDTPRLLGLSHHQYLPRLVPKGETFLDATDGELLMIGRESATGAVQFFPDISRISRVPVGKTWLPMEGCFANTLPSRGQVVVFID